LIERGDEAEAKRVLQRGNDNDTKRDEMKVLFDDRTGNNIILYFNQFIL